MTNINKEVAKKIAIGAGIAGAGAVLTYASAALMDLTYVVNVGDQTIDLTPAVTALLSVLVNFGRKSLGL